MLFTDWQLRQRRQLTHSLSRRMITNNRVNSRCHSHTHNGQVDSVFHSKSIQSQSKPQWRQHILTTALRYPYKMGTWRETKSAVDWEWHCLDWKCMLWQSEVWPCTSYRTHTHTLTALRISEYLIILPILNFISVPNGIFVGICNLNLLISSILTLILFRNILDFSNLKFSHFLTCILRFILTKLWLYVHITSGILGMYKDLFKKFEEKF